MARQCRGILLLDTCVSLGTTRSAESGNRANDMYATVSGVGCRPTRRWVFNQVKSISPFVYMPETQPNQEQFPVDWPMRRRIRLYRTRGRYSMHRTNSTNPQLREDVP